MRIWIPDLLLKLLVYILLFTGYVLWLLMIRCNSLLLQIWSLILFLPKRPGIFSTESDMPNCEVYTARIFFFLQVTLVLNAFLVIHPDLCAEKTWQEVKFYFLSCVWLNHYSPAKCRSYPCVWVYQTTANRDFTHPWASAHAVLCFKTLGTSLHVYLFNCSLSNIIPGTQIQALTQNLTPD
jgi:hypothetical protein